MIYSTNNNSVLKKLKSVFTSKHLLTIQTIIPVISTYRQLEQLVEELYDHRERDDANGAESHRPANVLRVVGELVVTVERRYVEIRQQCNDTLQTDGRVTTATPAGRRGENSHPTCTADGRVTTATPAGRRGENSHPTCTADGRVTTATPAGRRGENSHPTCTADGRVTTATPAGRRGENSHPTCTADGHNIPATTTYQTAWKKL